MIVLFIFAVSGCAQSSDDEYNAGNLRGYNHVAGQTVNHFSVNGYGGTMAGNTCCVMIPDKWSPGLTAHVEWEVDPQTAPPFPGYKDWDKYQAWEKKLKSSFKKYSTDVEIIQYDHSCGLTVHFLTCQKVKITAACSGYGTANYPVKEPLNMQEPASCPK